MSRDRRRPDADNFEAYEEETSLNGYSPGVAGRRRRRRSWLSVLLSLFALAILAAGGAAFGAKYLFEGPGPLEAERIIEIRSGSSLISIATQLEREGVIVNGLLFRAAARIQGVQARVQAGDYAIPAGASMRDVLTMVTTGQAIDYRITVAEGKSVAEAIQLVKAHKVLVGDVEKIPAEGMIAPETYFVRRGEKRQAVIDRMVAAQQKALEELWAKRAGGLPIKTAEEALILASIVEKETGVAGERKLVASVFVNRLRKGMRLQSDPTVIYGITKGVAPLGRGLRRSELKGKTAYNTYVIPALPPTPIANPGRKALEATLNPASSDFYYFVADGTGGHVFSRTLAEHNANVRKWRRIEAERARARKAAGK
ncbi:MAG: endolytic transglycosylase MltG [Neomegalonema sp.]|nr:endolytic transglycosylase MltG [Neomegalonema sp.]